MDVAGLLHLLRRRVVAIVLCLVVGVVVAVTVTRQTTPVYEAEATVLVNVPVADTTAAGVQGVQLTSNLLPSYAEIATSRVVADKVRSSLALPVSVAGLRGRISAEPLPDTLIIAVRARDEDKARARSMTDAVTVALREVVADLERGRRAEARVEIRVIDGAAVAAQPVTPDSRFNLTLGIVLGLAIGLALALLLDALDRTVKTAAQAETAAGAPVLGLVPKFRRGAAALVTLQDDNDAADEAFRTLRTGVRFVDPDNPLQVVLMTSASPGEGKTTTSLNLAVALAQGGESVVLVDADLRRASVASRLGLEGAVGLTDVVTRQAALADVLQVWNDLVTVLPAGALPPNPSEIVGSQSMGSVIEELRQRFDVVLLDAPPVLPVTDAVVLSTQVDGVLLVTRAGSTQRQLLAESRRRLDGVGAHVVGTVLNGVNPSTAVGYYASYRTASQGPGPDRS